MIIKKPYAFLIKNFKIIHLFLFALVTYIAFMSSNLLTFFNDYVRNGYYAYNENLTSTYVNVYMFIAIFFIIVAGVTIYILLKWKDKKRTLYVFLCGFYLLLFVVFTFYFGALNTIQNDVVDIRTVRIYRDIIMIATTPQYFFVVMSLIRAVGFDIKKFDFRKDLEELEIEAPDEEEVEITFGKDSYKIKRRFRRMFREFKYYALENKFFFGVICSLIVVSIGLSVYLNFEVYNKKYDQSDFFQVDGVSFNVTSSYGSNVDYKGDAIVNGKSYIVVNLHMKNNTDERKILNTEDIRLVLEGEDYLPVFSKNNHFIDLGEGFDNQTLYPGEEYEYLLVFEIPYEKVSKRYTFRLINSVDYLRGEIDANHRDVVIEPVYMNSLSVIETYELGDIINLGNGTLYESNVLVKNYDMKDEYIVNYDYCVSGKCYVGKKVIKSLGVGTIPKTIMRLEVDFDFNDELYISKYLKNSSDLIEMFGKLRYKVGGTTKTTSVSAFDFEYLDKDEVYLEVPYEVKSARDIILDINVRHAKFSINLKGGE